MIPKRQQARWFEDLIMDKSYPGRRCHIPEKVDLPKATLPEEWQRKEPAKLPEVSELQLVRHVVRLSQMNHGVDVGPYPLGSCTMKYNPKVNERIARIPQFSSTHPDAPEETIQGSIEVIYRLQEVLKEITGFSGVSVQPAAGAQGEYTGMLITRAYHKHRGDDKRKKVLIPDSAHGTNPASAAMAGYKVIEIPSTEDGFVDLKALESALDGSIAAFMITNPNTLGLFEPNIEEISRMVHQAGALMYLDGANFNGVVGMIRPADMGFDIMHFNMHKTFSGPHGGGGPGCGPVGVTSQLVSFLPKPLAAFDAAADRFYMDSDLPDSIGRLHGYNGNFGIILRSLAFIYRNGGEGLREMCQSAVLNANYLMHLVKNIKGFAIPKAQDVPRKHEFIASPVPMLKDVDVSANDIAKAMLDYGVHAPTIYFPLIVKEAMMFEPTEAETKDSLDLIAKVLEQISLQAYTDPSPIHQLPSNTARGRLDELALAKSPALSERQRSL